MTDALAAWFLGAVEEGGRPWKDLANVLSDPDPDYAFATWVSSLRATRRLRNDDVTLLMVRPNSQSVG